jgi:two-component system, NtrC family, nitrogen regulation sensor histidine kinase NtrY
MVFKSFKVNVVLRVLAIAILMAAFLYLAFIKSLYFSAFVVLLLLLFAIGALIYYTEKTSRDLNQFLLAVKYQDYSANFPNIGRGKSFNELKDSFNLIISEFQRIKLEKEIHHQFLQNVVGNIPIGIICYEGSGRIRLYNEAARNLLNVSYLGNFHQIEKIKPQLFEDIQKMRHGQAFLYKTEEGQINLQVKKIHFKLGEEGFNLITMQNITNELDFSEMESWQKLIRVLTHEIMNSVTPITSLSSTLEMMLQDAEGNIRKMQEVDDELITDVGNGIKAIRNRSKGLLSFVDNYRSFTRIPQPAFETIPVLALLKRVHALLKVKMEEAGIKFSIRCENPELKIVADQEQMEQVLINLLLNARDAVSGVENPEIVLSAAGINGSVIIKVSDNGEGIPPDVLDKIFIPFYTTKENGNGIGLSLSRQMILLNRGNITVQSTRGQGTVVNLKFEV